MVKTRLKNRLIHKTANQRSALGAGKYKYRNPAIVIKNLCSF